MTELTDAIAIAIDEYRVRHSDVTVIELLSAIELIRHKVTEALIST